MSQAKMIQQNKDKLTLNNKDNNFSRPQILLRGWKSFVLRLVLYVHAKYFRKKNKQAWNCLDNLILLYYWRVPLLTRLLNFYLYTLIFICTHLHECYKTSKVLNLFIKNINNFWKSWILNVLLILIFMAITILQQKLFHSK